MTTSPSANRRSRKTSEKAAQLAGASGRTTERIGTIARYMPELLPKIQSGEMSANAAYEETREYIAALRLVMAETGQPLDLGPRSRINERRPALPKCPYCDGTGRLDPTE